MSVAQPIRARSRAASRRADCVSPATALALLLFCLEAAPLVSQPMGLADALREALASNDGLEAARRNVEHAQFGVRGARADYLPALSLGGTLSELDGDVLFARFVNPLFPGQTNPFGEATDIGDFNEQETFSLQLEQTLYAGGATSARVRALEIERRIAAQDLEERRRELIFEVTRAYYGVLLADSSLAASEEDVKRAEEAVRTASALSSQGRARPAEELAARSQLAAARQARLLARNDRRRTAQALNQLLARDPAARVELAGALEGPLASYDEADVRRRAAASDPRVLRAQLRAELAELQERGSQAHYKPKIGLEAYYSEIDNETFFEGSDMGVNLRVSIPFFRDVQRGNAERGQARASQAIAASAANEAARAVEAELTEALLSMEEAAGALEAARQALELHRELVHVTRAALDQGTATERQLLDQQAELSAAEARLREASYLAREAEAQIRRLVGDGPESPGATQ